ncbi:hypothetical protein GCM10009096_02060 [Parasphingorhabdus litoris]|uniref:Uncharacterized protein n=1 Tax=Parasphingorhabdus litoris TaxID=394733 RepID=A0ABN1A190_9SPHN|nr:hypothetical protein [Parasphingorhabdus litoris]
MKTIFARVVVLSLIVPLTACGQASQSAETGQSSLADDAAIAATASAVEEPAVTDVEEDGSALPSGVKVESFRPRITTVSQVGRDEKQIGCGPRDYALEDLEYTAKGAERSITAIKFVLQSNGTSSCNRREDLVNSSYDAPPSAGGLADTITIFASTPSLVELRGANNMQSTFDAAQLAGDDLAANALMRCSANPESPNVPEGKTGFRLMCGPIDISEITDLTVVAGESKQANLSIDLTVIEN